MIDEFFESYSLVSRPKGDPYVWTPTSLWVSPSLSLLSKVLEDSFHTYTVHVYMPFVFTSKSGWETVTILV